MAEHCVCNAAVRGSSPLASTQYNCEREYRCRLSTSALSMTPYRDGTVLAWDDTMAPH